MENVKKIIWLKGILPNLRHLSLDNGQKETVNKLLFTLMSEQLKDSAERGIFYTEHVGENIVFHTTNSRILFVLDYDYTIEKLHRDAESLIYDTIIVLNNTPKLTRNTIIKVASLYNMIFCSFTIPEIIKPRLKIDDNEVSEIIVDDEIEANNYNISEFKLQKNINREKIIRFLKKAIPKILNYIDIIIQCISGKCELINQLLNVL